jgi:integrase
LGSARGYRQGENPARWRGHVENLLPQKSKVRRVEHYAALPYPEIGGFMRERRQQGGTAARALEFAILTAARTSEVIGAKWDEIDLGGRLWTVPAERMKGGKEHRIPISDAALSILECLRKVQQDNFVFPGGKAGRPISNMAMLMVLRRMGRDDLTAHGFRSSFRDWAAQRSTFAAEVAEMALAHTIGDKVEAACRRGDLFQKRRQLAEAWAKFCAVARHPARSCQFASQQQRTRPCRALAPVPARSRAPRSRGTDPPSATTASWRLQQLPQTGTPAAKAA